MTDAFWWPDHDLTETGTDHLHEPLGHDHLDPGAEAVAPVDHDVGPFAEDGDGWAPYDGSLDAGEPESLNGLVYGASGVDGVAHDLWSQLLPGAPVPTGLDGAELTGADLLNELRERVHDPMLANVIDSMLAEWRG